MFSYVSQSLLSVFGLCTSYQSDHSQGEGLTIHGVVAEVVVVGEVVNFVFVVDPSVVVVGKVVSVVDVVVVVVVGASAVGVVSRGVVVDSVVVVGP